MRSPARMRWPVDEIGRNSVRPSTMPRMSASSRLCNVVFQEISYALPELGSIVGAIVPRAAQLYPPFGAFPGVEKTLRMDHGDDLVALGAEAKQRRFDPRRALDGVEGVPQHPADRQIRVMVSGDIGQAVERRHEDYAAHRAGGGKLDGHAAAQAPPGNQDVS